MKSRVFFCSDRDDGIPIVVACTLRTRNIIIVDQTKVVARMAAQALLHGFSYNPVFPS